MEVPTENNTLFLLRQALDNATAQLNQAQQLMASITGEDITSAALRYRTDQLSGTTFEGNAQVLEGVFNGQNMVGADGKIYTVPANYASKSKLVEGDILKLTIRPDGSFIYKQIGPVERKRVIGTLVRDAMTGDFSVLIGKRSYKVIMASITYYKGEPGDEVVILTPEDGESVWAAVENVIRAGSGNNFDFTAQVDSKEVLLPSGEEAELPSGDSAELPDGSEAELAE